MTVSTLRPTGTTTNDGALTGGATAHAVLSDNSDASYILLSPSNNTECTLGDFTLPAGALITTVALRARTALITGVGNDSNVRAGYGAVGIDDLLSLNYNVTWTAITTTTIASLSRAFTDAECDDAVFWWNRTPVAGTMRLYEAYLDVTHVILPVVTVSAPTGAITTTNLPAVTWSNVLDSDGGPQTRYQVKFFTAAQYGIGGFDPAVSPNTLDSGALGLGTENILTWTPTTPLADGTYRAYVRTAQSVVGGEGQFGLHWSAWAFSAFTLAVALPAVPTLTATADGVRINLTLDDAAGVASTDVFEIQRSIDAGVTWGTVRQLVAGYLSAANVLSVNAGGIETSSADWANTTNVTTSQSATFALDGTNSLRLSSTAGGDMASMTAAKWPVTTGLSYTARASVRAGASARSSRVDIQFYDAAGAFISTTTGTPVADAVGSWTVISATAVAPALATQANLVLRVLATGAGAELHYIDRISLKPQVTLYDYEAPNGVATQYRARALHLYSTLYAASAWSATKTATWESDSWWLKHPHIPALRRPVKVRSFQSVARAGRTGVFQPLGASSAVVVSDTRGPATGAITLRLDTLAEQAALDALLNTTATLLLQSPLGEGGPNYIRVSNHQRQRIADKANFAARTFDTLDFTVVDSPPGQVVAWS